MSTHQTHTFDTRWRETDITVLYTPLKWGVISHLEIQSQNREPLPISETGYRSHFFYPEDADVTVENVVSHVLAWLDAEAQSEAWRSYIEASRQGCLF